MSDDLVKKWLEGNELSSAWRFLPDRELQMQYDASGDSVHRREFVIAMMQGELATRLARGEFLVLGVSVAPTASGEVHSIPPHFFANKHHVDWDSSAVQAYDQVFEDARVVGLPSLYRTRHGHEARSEASALPGSIPSIPSTGVEVEKVDDLPIALVGRPSVIPLLRAIIRELKAQDKLNCTPGRRYALIARATRDRHPDNFGGGDGPSPNTVRKALRLEGLVADPAQKVQKPARKNSRNF